MGRIPKILLTLCLLTMSGCLDSQPKTLGNGKKFDFSAFDAGGFNFKINFALSGVSRGRANVVYLQGAANTKSGAIGTCNLSGTSCACEFLNTAGDVLYTTSQTEISYDERGNYYRCTNSSGTSPTKIRIRNNSSSVISQNLDILSSVTLGQLIGNELDANKVRSIFRYECLYNFLQKEGTTTQSFDCSKQTVTCDPESPANPNKHFCILTAKFPYYLFSDNGSTNFFKKIADKVYNGAGTGKICNLSIKQINCVSADGVDFGTPIKKFGLFAINTGIWDTSISLPPAPDLANESVGFAARTSATTSECPPGLVKKIFFTSKVVTSDITPTHNFVSDQTATEVEEPGTTVSAFAIGKISGGSGGNCDNVGCVLPNSTVIAGAKTPIPYTTTGQTAFCVIPGNLIQ